ncbi:MAG TPA: hypothetical protein P5110_03530 [Candidatus Omnitrophota bacterium]|nr:hypothetical protein [Candidatus Omnitrophota bacterium]HRZ14562.1 hypothetical protein [Candidatus Omnitrophota bacterium]
MEKGLCLTCEHGSSCCFSRTAPVYQCEEFSIPPAPEAGPNGKKTGRARPAAAGEPDSEE